MDQVLKAIKTKLDATGELTADLPDGVHLHRAPQKFNGRVPSRFALIIPISAVPEYNTDEQYTQPVQIQFSFYAPTFAQAQAAAVAWRDAFNHQPLTLPTGTLLDASLTNEASFFEAADGELTESYHYLLEFTFLQQQAHQA